MKGNLSMLSLKTIQCNLCTISFSDVKMRILTMQMWSMQENYSKKAQENSTEIKQNMRFHEQGTQIEIGWKFQKSKEMSLGGD